MISKHFINIMAVKFHAAKRKGIANEKAIPGYELVAELFEMRPEQVLAAVAATAADMYSECYETVTFQGAVYSKAEVKEALTLCKKMLEIQALNVNNMLDIDTRTDLTIYSLCSDDYITGFPNEHFCKTLEKILGCAL